MLNARGYLNLILGIKLGDSKVVKQPMDSKI